MADNKDFVSKCVAIQYGVFIASIVLLVVVAFNWYSEYSNSCLATCKAQHKMCKTECVPQNGMSDKAPGLISKFTEPVYHKKSEHSAKHVKLDEKHLHEGFLNYSPAQSASDFDTYYNKTDENPDAQEYDPAQESLEQSVYDSHKEFVDDSYISTQGPSSINVERDDETGPVKRWGLRRIDYTTTQVGDDARQVPSEYAEQVEQTTDSYML
jgi:hypothetical protein